MSGMDARNNRIGEKFGFWTIIGAYNAERMELAYPCRCVCGHEKEVLFGSMRRGASKSCGCQSTQLRNRFMVKHGMASTPTYKSWHAMTQRVAGKGGHEEYVNRGIKMCDQWHDFNVFLADMGERPAGKTLDRIDNNGDYSPENCRWATYREQSSNRNCNHLVKVVDEVMTFTEACAKHNIHEATVRGRIRSGMDFISALTRPVQYKRKKS